MKEIPILYNGNMVRAILEGRKTKDRRPVKLPNGSDPAASWYDNSFGLSYFHVAFGSGEDRRFERRDIKCPYGQPGDILWVRETWTETLPDGDELARPIFRAEGTDFEDFDGFTIPLGRIKWRPSIHMPRRAARIFLRVKSVRIERVQDITDDEAIAEGIIGDEGYRLSGPCFGDQSLPRDCYANLWQSLYGTWAEKPWVWVIEFERVESEARHE